MGVEQYGVREIVERAVRGEWDIPEFQRGFVWKPEQVVLLAESLYQDYPVGTFLLWDSSEYHQPRGADGTQPRRWIVDGQQRATALCLLLGQKPYWWKDADSWNQLLKKHDVTVNLMGEEPSFSRQRGGNWISLRTLLNLSPQGQKTKAQEIAEGLGVDPMDVYIRIQEIQKIKTRLIPVISINKSVEEVVEVFSRLNQAGTKVKEADVTLALIAAANPGWVREEFLPYTEELEEKGWDLDVSTVIRTITLIGQGKARLKEVHRDFWNPEFLKPVWNRTKTAITTVIQKLARYGVLSSDLVPSLNTLIPLFVLEDKWGNEHPDYFPKAFWWFLAANGVSRYGASSITILEQDVQDIQKSNGLEEALRKLEDKLGLKEGYTLEPQDFLQPGNRFLRLMVFLLLYDHGAVDWVTETRLGYDKSGSPLSMGFEPNWHHIYPKSLLKGNEKASALANLTVLNEKTNVNKLKNKPPARYIQEFKITPEKLSAHLIPQNFAHFTDEAVWSIENYETFIAQRAELLAQKANQYLSRLKGQN